MTMTLSVVPVRFEYACGHTALTSLPRVKAESPAQRIVRISQEKAAAGQRACDFCPSISPSSMGASDLDGVGRLTVTLAPPAIAPSMIDGIDNPPFDHAVASEQVPEQEQEEAMMTTTTEPVSEPATARDERPATPETTPAPTRPKGVLPLRKLTDEQEHEVTRLYADTTTPLVEIGRRFGIGQTSVARIAQRRGAPLRSPTISRAMASDRPGPAAADTGPALERETTPVQPEPVVPEPVEPEPAAQPTGAPTVARGPRSVTSRQRPAPVARRPRAHAPVKAALISSAPATTATRRRRSGAGVAGASLLRRFVVTFSAEQVLEAASALDALQQVRARGATEVTAIVRTD
jgi:hypothetical protein